MTVVTYLVLVQLRSRYLTCQAYDKTPGRSTPPRALSGYRLVRTPGCCAQLSLKSATYRFGVPEWRALRQLH